MVDALRQRAIGNRDMTYADSMALAYQNALVNTSVAIDDNMLAKTTEAIAGARRVFLFGTNVTRLACEELGNNITLLGMPANSYTNPGDIEVHSRLVDKDDVVIMMSNNLFVTEMFDALTALSDVEVPVIGITNYDSPRLNELLYAKFLVYSKMYYGSTKYPVNPVFPFLFLSDVIFGRLSESNPAYMEMWMKANSLVTKDTFLYDSYL